jgi:hypothetical protein
MNGNARVGENLLERPYTSAFSFHSFVSFLRFFPVMGQSVLSARYTRDSGPHDKA